MRHVPKRIEMLDDMIQRATSISFNGQKAIKIVHIMIWRDNTNYPSHEVDSGHLKRALDIKYKARKDVRVFEVKKGGIFCVALNLAIAYQSQAGCRYSLIASAEASSYLNKHTICEMILGMKNGARVCGVAINELQDSILEGRVANTFAMWHNLSLLSVGGFDLRAEKPTNKALATYMRGFSNGKEVYYHLAGVEEMIPLKRLIDFYGKCISVVMPYNNSGERQVYQIPKNPEDMKRHYQKMGTKLERQCAFLALEGVDTSFIKGGLMNLLKIEA